MIEFFQSLSPSLQKPVIILGPMLLVGGIIAIVAIISCYVAKIRLSFWETSLKSQMIERGMNADEIERILSVRAHWSKDEESAAEESRNVKADPQANLATYLTECWYGAADVAKILNAIAQRPNDPANRKIDFALVRELANQWSDADDIIRVLNARQPVKENEVSRA